jgi:DNA primase
VAGRISDQVVEQVRHANDVVEVIGSYFPLKRAGANFRALCPFHKEKTPSFHVHPGKQIWHCFGCGKGGDVFKFVMEYESLDFLAAVRRLAERAGIKIETEADGAAVSRDVKTMLYRLHEEVAAFYQENLGKAGVALRYLEKRQISREVARRWRIGFATDSWDGLLQWTAGKNYTPQMLELAGLALPGERGHYDRFRGRLMFSICDDQGRVIGFSGRILTDDKEQPKYVNSPETPIFQKGRVLFALDKAKRAIVEEKVAVLCEGQIDTIACHEAGLENVVAPQGTALTEQQARILKRYAEEVVLMYDADVAGQNAIVRSAEPLWEAGMAIRVAVIPGTDDPDSYLKTHGREALKNLITASQSFFVYLLERLSATHDPRSERGKLQIVRQMAEWLVRIPSPVLLATYAQQTAQRLEVPEESVRQELRKLQASRRRGVEPAPVQEPVEEVIEGLPNQPAELMLLQLVIADVRVADLLLERLEPGWLTGSPAGRLIEKIMAAHSRGQWDGLHSMMGPNADEEDTKLLAAVSVQAPASQDPQGAAGDCLAALERGWVERRLHELRKHLRQTDLKTQERDKILREILDLQPKLRNIPALSMRKP